MRPINRSTTLLIAIAMFYVTVNGFVPTAQDVPIGGYIDTLQVVVNY
jgi:spore coat protein U-like protein